MTNRGITVFFKSVLNGAKTRWGLFKIKVQRNPCLISACTYRMIQVLVSHSMYDLHNSGGFAVVNNSQLKETAKIKNSSI